MSLKIKLLTMLQNAEERRQKGDKLCRKLEEAIVSTLGNRRSNFDVSGVNEWFGNHKVWVTTLTWYGGASRYNVLSLYANPVDGTVYLKLHMYAPCKYIPLTADYDTCLGTVAEAILKFIKHRGLSFNPRTIGVDE